MRARELIQRLEDAGLDSEVRIRIVVGGDLRTDDVELVAAHDHGDAHGTYLILEPADPYGLEDLLDNALAARHAIDDAEQLGNGYVRWTRAEDGELILDHVDATRIIITAT